MFYPKLVVLYFLTLWVRCRFDICHENNGLFSIKEAFRLDKHLILLTQTNVYRVNDFQFINGQFNFSSIDRVTDWNNWTVDMKLVFTFKFKSENTSENRVIGINWQQVRHSLNIFKV